MLMDLDYEICKAASKEYISSGKFPPSIADIREKCTAYTQSPIKDYGEAWGSVLKAIRKYGYMEEEQALNSMDELTRKCVKSLGFQNICHDEEEAAMRANFRMIYEQEANRAKRDNQVPVMLMAQKQQRIEKLIDSTVQQIEKKEEPVMEAKEADMENVGEMMKNLRRNLYGSTI